MIKVTIEGRLVQVRAWRRIVTGISGQTVEVYFLDTAIAENTPWDQTLTDYLYVGDSHYRLCQELVLGVGGIAMLRELGYNTMQAYHMNEGHSALLTLALLAERTGLRGMQTATREDREAIRRQCVFTTHTPVPAGHDQFPKSLVHQVIGDELTKALDEVECFLDNTLNMTHLALLFSHYINGVSMRHEEISRGMFPGYPINSVTNGVHALTWTSPPFCQLYDKHIPEWRRDNLYLRYATSIHLDEIRQAHIQAKNDLFAEIKRRTNIQLDHTKLTIGFARRATMYKRPDLLFNDLDRLKRISSFGPLQVIYAGKAHPNDEGGKSLIRSIFQAAEALRDSIPVIYLEEYDMNLARYLVSGVDIWLNTPKKPEEASGTSGMKAALNGVPSLSILDGWWVEGHVEGVTGWSIDESWESDANIPRETHSLYEKLEYLIVPLYYVRPMEFIRIMRATISLNGSYYNAERMLFQYLDHAYFAEEDHNRMTNNSGA